MPGLWWTHRSHPRRTRIRLPRVQGGVMSPVETFVAAVIAGLRAGLTPEQITAAILTAVEVQS